MKNKILNIKNLSKSYGAFKVTDEITIDLHFDEIHALIGPNGAGKSTLIKQIVGSVKHDIGSIILDQEDITDLTDVESCLLYTSPSPRDSDQSRMPSSA